MRPRICNFRYASNWAGSSSNVVVSFSAPDAHENHKIADGEDDATIVHDIDKVCKTVRCPWEECLRKTAQSRVDQSGMGEHAKSPSSLPAEIAPVTVAETVPCARLPAELNVSWTAFT